MRSLEYLPLAALALVACQACQRHQEPGTFDRGVEPKVVVAPKNVELGVGGGPVEPGGAVDKILEARCDRELKCGNLGPSKQYADRDACNAAMRKSLADELNADECPAGIDIKELDECLHAARNEDCKNPFDTIGRAAACRTSDICRHVK